MRQLLINELSDGDLKKIEHFMEGNAEAGAIPGIYWLLLPDVLRTDLQNGHQQCGPFVFGIELGRASLSLELLVRGKGNLHCGCTSYATVAQRQFLLDFYDRMIRETELKS